MNTKMIPLADAIGALLFVLQFPQHIESSHDIAFVLDVNHRDIRTALQRFGQRDAIVGTHGRAHSLEANNIYLK
jgi:hypothetical protein